MLTLLLIGGAVLLVLGMKATDWTSRMKDAVANALPSLSSESQAIVVAQAAYESGFGAGLAATQGNNPFNITAGSSWKGAVVEGHDQEYDAFGNVRDIVQRFRAYDSLETAVADYWHLLGTPNYAGAQQLLAQGDAAAFIGRLAQARYFTLPVAQYWKGFSAALVKVSP